MVEHGGDTSLGPCAGRPRPAAAGRGLVWTWPAIAHGRIPPITIDHVLVDRRVRVERLDVVRIPGCDHRAVIATLRLPS